MTGAIVAAGIVAVVAGALLVGSPRADRLWAHPSAQRASPQRILGILGGAAGLVVVAASGVLAQWLAPIVAIGLLAGVGTWLAARTRTEHTGLRNERAVIRACTMLTGQLDAGDLPAHALGTVVGDVPLLKPVAGAIGVGGDVTGELMMLAASPGCAGLEALARSWRLCEHTGMPLGPVTRLVTDTLRQQQDVRAARRAELATARSTGRLLAGLPLVGLGMGFFVDADPLAFLLGTTAGNICLVAAAALASAGLVWTERLAGEAT